MLGLKLNHVSKRGHRCTRLLLDNGWRRRVCGRTHRRCGLSRWRHCVFSDKSRFTVFHSDGRARVRHRQVGRLIEARIQRVPSTMVRGVNWRCWMEPSTANATPGFSVTVCFPDKSHIFSLSCKFVIDFLIRYNEVSMYSLLVQEARNTSSLYPPRCRLSAESDATSMLAVCWYLWFGRISITAAYRYRKPISIIETYYIDTIFQW